MFEPQKQCIRSLAADVYSWVRDVAQPPDGVGDPERNLVRKRQPRYHPERNVIGGSVPMSAFRGASILLIVSASFAQSPQPNPAALTAEAIMARVAANQDRRT